MFGFNIYIFILILIYYIFSKSGGKLFDFDYKLKAILFLLIYPN